MKDKYIALLKKQIEKLDLKDFDLDSWKDSTTLVLDRIFGPDSEKINKINEIHYDLSSWSLRDTLGTSAHFDACKKKGREILEVCITELETIGIPERVKDDKKPVTGIIRAALEDELKISQYKELEKIIKESSRETVEKNIFDFLGKIGSENAMTILSKILSSLYEKNQESV